MESTPKVTRRKERRKEQKERQGIHTAIHRRWKLRFQKVVLMTPVGPALTTVRELGFTLFTTFHNPYVILSSKASGLPTVVVALSLRL